VTDAGADRTADADEHRAEVIGLPLLVRLDPAVAVEVLVDGEWWPGFASAYRGRRVSVSWRKGLGMQHVTWEPADHVRRT